MEAFFYKILFILFKIFELSGLVMEDQDDAKFPFLSKSIALELVVPASRDKTQFFMAQKINFQPVKYNKIENIEEVSQGKRIIAQALIPFIRPRTITVTGECFRPGIRVYAFFDGKAVSQQLP